MELYLATFSVKMAVEEVVANVKSAAIKKNIHLQIEIDDGLDTVCLDEQKFKQVLYNLVSNAIKFTNSGGIVLIKAGLLKPGYLQVMVHDTGIGIKEMDIPRLFTEFEQLDAGVARRFEGTGL